MSYYFMFMVFSWSLNFFSWERTRLKNSALRAPSQELKYLLVRSNASHMLFIYYNSGAGQGQGKERERQIRKYKEMAREEKLMLFWPYLNHITKQQIIMSSGSKKQYTWTNRQAYDNHGVQQLGDKLTSDQTEQQQQQNTERLFERVLSKSDFAMLHFNEQTKEMTLHSTSSAPIKYIRGWASRGFMKSFSDIKNYFVYGVECKRLAGQRGVNFAISASKEVKGADCGVQYRKTLWERLDNHMSSNKDQLSLFCDYKNIKLALSRQSRGNYLNFYDKSKITKDSKVFGSKQEELTSLKHSNLLSLALQSQHSFGSLRCKLGWDYGNKSYFTALGFKLQSNHLLSRKLRLNLSLEGADIIGVNLLKNDLLFRNSSQWPGSRSSNFLSPRAELMFNQYPFISLWNLKPYLYAQLWTSLTKENQSFVTRVEADYGIGIMAFSNSRFDLSLLQLSGEKVGRLPFGGIRFSF